jgi:hypothetical protein
MSKTVSISEDLGHWCDWRTCHTRRGILDTSRKFCRKILSCAGLLIGCHSIPLWSDRDHDLVALFSTLGNEDMPSIHSSSNETPLDIAGPITRSRAKQLQKEIHSQVNANLMFNNQSMLNEPMLLSSCFNVLMNDGVYEPAWDQDGFKPLDI